MLKLKHITLFAGLLAATVLTAMPASASQSKRDTLYRPVTVTQPYARTQYQAPQYRAQQRWAQSRISASQAKSIARQHVPGASVVDIFLNGNTYRVRMLRRDGRVVDVFIDAATGRVR